MKKLAATAFVLGFGLMIGAIQVPRIIAQNAPVTPAQAAPGNSKTELNARLEERKAKQPARPSTAESARLAARCQAAQQKVDALFQRSSAAQQPLKEKYEAQQARLQAIQQKLKARGADTTQLDTRIAEANQKYQVLIAATSALNLSISDLKSVDCKADPAAFKSTLQAAREEIKAVRDLRVSLHSFVKGPLHDALKATKASLPANQE